LGNFFTVRDLLDQGVPGEVIRFVFLSTHYRKPMDWTAEKAREARIALNVIYQDGIEGMLEVLERSPEKLKELPEPNETMVCALKQDLNTPEALRIFRAEAKKMNADKKSDALHIIANGKLLGFFQTGWHPTNIAQKDVLARYRKELEGARKNAMKTKDFSNLDRLKSALVEAGVDVRMSKDSVVLIAGPDFDPAKLESLK
jgi:cysteinyl-tRNA synthetase